MTAPAPQVQERGAFARRVAGVLSTRVTLFVLAFLTSIIVSRLLGREGKGVYVAVATLPGMLAAIGLFGLPGAVNYFAGKGHSLSSLIRASYLYTVVISVVLVAVVWVMLPVLEGSVLRAASLNDDLLRLILLSVPLGTLSAFGGSILYGRMAVRSYNLIQIAMAAVSLTCVIVLVGVFRLGVPGAVAGSIVVAAGTTVLVMFATHRLAGRDTWGPPAPMRGLAAYAARLYPGSITGFFSYRADNYLIQALIVDPKQAAAMLGLYSMAVTMDELVFYVPDSITTLFLPRVAGSTAEDSARMLGRVGRLTLLVTVGIAVCLVPAAYVGIHLVLPAFEPCLPAFLVLLPGVISLSVAKVATSYVSGRGRPGLVSMGTLAALVLNVVLNLFFIPAFGIVGAALASLFSYTFQAVVALHFASRLSGQPILSLFVPGRADVALVVETSKRLVGQLPFPRRGAAGPDGSA
jgi:O-antigen/teichoic acid export membrane protein